MTQSTTVKVVAFQPEKCNGCMDCMKACSKVHFKTENGGEKSAIKIIKQKDSYKMHVCDQRGLCLDMCPVGALSRRKNGIVWLDKKICIGCQACIGFCPIGAMRKATGQIEPFKCISCGACVRACPENALELVEHELEEIKEIVFHNYKKE
jgi:Fe-S-cluster-containing hydrogenase component 2